MKKFSWLIALFVVLAISMAFVACSNGPGDQTCGVCGNDPCTCGQGHGDVDPVLAEFWRLTTDFLADKTVGAIPFAERQDYFEPELAAAASAEPSGYAFVVNGDALAIEVTTGISTWGVGLDLQNDFFEFKVGDKITVDVEHISGSFGAETDRGIYISTTPGSGETERTTEDSHTFELTLTQAHVTQINNANPKGIRIGAKPGGIVFRINEIVIERLTYDCPCGCSPNADCGCEPGQCCTECEEYECEDDCGKCPCQCQCDLPLFPADATIVIQTDDAPITTNVDTYTLLTAVYTQGTGPATVTYHWYRGSTSVGSSTTLRPDTAGTYTVVIRNADFQDKASSTVTVVNSTFGADTLVIESDGSDDVADNVELSIDSDSGVITMLAGKDVPTANITFQWRRNGTNIGGETDSTFTPTTAGTYSVVLTVTGFTGSVTSNDIAMTNSDAFTLGDFISLNNFSAAWQNTEIGAGSVPGQGLGPINHGGHTGATSVEWVENDSGGLSLKVSGTAANYGIQLRGILEVGDTLNVTGTAFPTGTGPGGRSMVIVASFGWDPSNQVNFGHFDPNGISYDLTLAIATAHAGGNGVEIRVHNNTGDGTEPGIVEHFIIDSITITRP